MSQPKNPPPAGYRPCVGVVLFNGHGLVFAGRRVDTPGDAWQLPQGGIEAGEAPRAAGLRELAEEIGTDSARIIDELPNWLTYDLPEDLAARIWGGRYRGQAQIWLLARFMGLNAPQLRGLAAAIMLVVNAVTLTFSF